MKILVFFIGTCVGSFVNVIILRLPEKKNFTTDRSKCPKCNSQLKWFHNIPIVSYITLKGKCAFCKTPISKQYPIIELIHGFIFLFYFESFWKLSVTVGIEHLMKFFIISILIAHFLIDLRYKLLLDKLNMALIVPVLVLVLLNGNWLESLIGGFVGFGFPLAVTWLFYLMRGKIGLGGGDIKLFGILGILFSAKGVILNLFTSCMLGSLITILLMSMKKVKGNDYIPFGPYIISVALFQLILPDYFRAWETFLIPYY